MTFEGDQILDIPLIIQYGNLTFHKMVKINL